MNATGLPARMVYAVVALALGFAAGFYATLWEYPILLLRLQGIDADLDGYEIFKVALGVAAVVAFTAFLMALTLPWSRHRRRSGRGGRLAISGVLVVLASLVFAGLHHRVIYDLAFAVWLAYVMAYTYVRYGLRDPRRHPISYREDSSSTDDSD
jgi:O-antigen/teichoic acid export membrane protein